MKRIITIGLPVIMVFSVLGGLAATFDELSIRQAKINDQEAVIESYKVTEKHLNELQEGLIKGEGYTVTRQENTDVIRYIIGSCVKKEIQMFVPTDK